MGENEQGGMLRTVVVIGLIAIIAIVMVVSVVGLKGNMLAGTSNATDGIQKEIKKANGNTVEEVTDDYDTSNHYYTFNDTNKTAVIGRIKSGEAKDKGSVVVPSYVTHSGVKHTVVGIGKYAYGDSPELTDVTIPDTIKSIGYYAFTYNSELAKVTIGKGVETIGNWAFSNTALSSVTVPDNVKTIGEGAFYNNTHLTNVTIPDNVKTIEQSAFGGIPNAKDGFVSIGKDTTYIQDGLSSSFGSHKDSNGNDIGYKPTIRS